MSGEMCFMENFTRYLYLYVYQIIGAGLLDVPSRNDHVEIA